MQLAGLCAAPSSLLVRGVVRCLETKQRAPPFAHYCSVYQLSHRWAVWLPAFMSNAFLHFHFAFVLNYLFICRGYNGLKPLQKKRIP